MKKRFVSAFLTVLTLVALVPVTALGFGETQGYCGGDTTAEYHSGSQSYKNLSWVFDGETLTISGKGPMGYYNGWHNCSVDGPWYAHHGAIKKIVIEDGVTTIGNYAFRHCVELTQVVIPESVTTIGDRAFYNCRSLPDITFPRNLTAIGEKAFDSCYSLRSAPIPEGVKYIGAGAFSQCYDLESVTIPAGLDGLENGFIDCESLRSVVIPRNGTDSVAGFGSCHNLRSVIIQDGITTIANYAFENCSGLRSVTIPNSVTTIGVRVFAGCKELRSVVIPDSVTYFGPSAFADCDNLESVTIPAGVKWLEDAQFSGCDALQTVTFREGIRGIGEKAFSNCPNLRAIFFTGTQEQWEQVNIHSNCTLYGLPVYFGVCPLPRMPEISVPADEYCITVLAPDGTPVEGASVRWKDAQVDLTRQTKKDGTVFFPRQTVNALQISVSGKGYLPWSNAGSFWEKSAEGKETVILYPESMSALKLAVARYSNNDFLDKSCDVLTHSKTLSITSELGGRKIDPDDGIFSLKCSAVDPTAVRGYLLYQGGKEMAGSIDGYFPLLNKNDFIPGECCIVRVVGKDGKTADTYINLIFAKSQVNKADTLSLKGEKLSFAVGDDVPFFGGGTMEFDLPVESPLEFVATDEKVYIGVNVDLTKGKPKDVIEETKKTITQVKKAANTKIDKNTEKKLKSLIKEKNKAEFFKKVDVIFLGYIEADWGSSVGTGELALMITTKAIDVEYNTVVVVVPVTVQVEVSMEAEGAGKFSYDWEEDSFTGEVVFDPAFGVNVFCGPGVSTLLGVGTYGDAELKADLRLLGSPRGLRSVDLTGELGIKAYLGLLSYEIAFAHNTWNLYTANQVEPALLMSGGEALRPEIYDADAYELHDLSYLAGESAWLGECGSTLPVLMANGNTAAKTVLTPLLENTYRNAQPVAVSAGGKVYAAFLRADEDGNVYTAVTGYDGTAWAAPVRADDTAVLDGAPRLFTDADGTIWLACTQTGEVEDKTSLTGYAAAQTLVVGTVDPETLAFTKAAEYTGDYIHLPELTAVGDRPALVWAESEVLTDNDVLMPETSRIYFAVYDGGAWQEKQREEEISLPIYELCPSRGMEELRLAVSVDGDGDLATRNDTELVVDGDIVAENAFSVRFAQLPGESAPCFLWIQDGVLCSEQGPELSGVENEYSVTENAVFFSNASADLSACKYVNGVWSEPITLAEDQRYLEDLTALDTAWGEIVLGMNTNAAVTEDTVTDEKDLVWSKVTAVNDLRLEYLAYDDGGVASGKNVEITVGVTNAGDHQVSDLELTLDGEKIPVDCPGIAPGETAELTFITACPAVFREYSVEINENKAADYVPGDNARILCLGRADLTLSTAFAALDGLRQVEVTVTNRGIAPTGGMLTLFDPAGSAVADAPVSDLAAGDSSTVVFPVDGESGSGLYLVQLVSNDEAEKDHNNTAQAYVPAQQEFGRGKLVSITGLTAARNGTVIQLLDEDTGTVRAQTTVADGECGPVAVPEGSYTLRVSRSGYIPRESAVCIDGDTVWESLPEPVLTGDVNGTVGFSGTAVDAADMQCLFTYLSVGKREGQITDEAYFLAVADVNGDGEVNILDYQALYEQVRGAS